MPSRIVVSIVAVAAVLAFAAGAAGRAQAPSPSEKPILRDDFSKPSKAWHRSGGSAKYVGGSLRLSTPDLVVFARSLRSVPAATVRVEVDATRISGPDAGEVALVCGPDPSHFYGLGVSGDGRYSFTRLTPNGMKPLKVGRTRGLRRGGARNHLSGTCATGPVGTPTTLSLSLNGKRVGSVSDGDGFGRVTGIGLWLAPHAKGAIEVAFDNLAVYSSDLLFHDDFAAQSPPGRGWEPGTFSYGTVAYAGGALHLITVSDPDLGKESLESYLNLQVGPLSSLRIEVDATKISGPDHDNIAVECGPDSDHVYRLVILQDGRYGFTRLTFANNNLADLQLLKLEATPAVRAGAEPNHISGTCQAGPAGTPTTLGLTVNGQPVDTVTDPNGFGPLRVFGIQAASRDPSAAVDVAFDNLFVYGS